jgi:outer membrane protein TolC
MKHFVILSFALALCNPLIAQVNSANNLVSASMDIREKLVTLALQNPDVEVADRRIEIAKYELKEAKGWWFNNISLAFNANDFTVNRLLGKTTQADGRLYPIYPLYNFGLNIPIGGIFSKPAATKAAREQVAIEQASRNSKYRQVRAAVLTAYEDYITNKNLLTVQSQITESTYSNFLQAKEKFRNGQISLDDYGTSARSYHDEVVKRINAEHDFNLSKIQLEELIGEPISNVLTDSGTNQVGTPSDSVNSK